MSGMTWTSLVNADLLLSLRVPVGWEVEVFDEARFRIYRDGADAADYRASMGFVLGEPEAPGPEWFERFSGAVPSELARTAEEYDQIGTERFSLSSGAKVFEVRARQHATGAPATSQILSYVWANSYRMYVIDASTLREHEQRDFPVFDQILRSIRVLPPRR